jgi:DNA mismatch repair protein MutL
MLLLHYLMPLIKVLPPDLRNKIAAGEVVERPASVVKELIENSIDAGSSYIKVDVLYGGKRLMRVSDNGTGMDREDALLCFERHATSKLSTEDDLFNIKTMGFRGEALSSIASVSKVTITTGAKGSSSGVSIVISGGEVKEMKDAPSTGTIIEVRDIFFNTPARKKFLKSNSTELFHIIDTVTKEALAHWGIAFRLTSDHKETITLPLASGPKERIMQVYGEEFLDDITGVDTEAAGLKMAAFFTKGDNFRNMKSHQFIFVNRRPIKDQSISHAVYKAYESIIPRDKHPVFFLFLDIDPGRVDFNVHPAKREVRFEDKESVYRFVHETIRASVKSERTKYAKQFTEMPEIALPKLHSGMYSSPNASAFSQTECIVSENIELAYRTTLPFIYLGDTFLAVAGKGGLTLIDHHAAHERILFEKFLKGINPGSHQLLFPKQIKLSAKEYRVLIENADILRDFGIEADDFGHETVLVRSLPDALDDADLRGILSDVASCIIERIAPDKSLKEALAARIACHNSVRGKEILNQEQLSALLSDLEQTDHPDQCPHGRPTRIFLSLDDLKKMFKRK